MSTGGKLAYQPIGLLGEILAGVVSCGASKQI